MNKLLTDEWLPNECDTEGKALEDYNNLEQIAMRMFSAVDKGKPIYPRLSKSAVKAILNDCIRARIHFGEILQKITEGEVITNADGDVMPPEYVSDLLNINEKLIQQLRSY